MEAKQELGGKMLLGEILLERGLITKPQLDQAIRVQVGGMRRLGSILVRMKLLTGDDLTKALSARLKPPIVKIEDEYRDNAKTVLPRVAIADVESYTGRAVQAVLARPHDIDGALPSQTVFSRHDLFNPQVYRSAAGAAIGART